MTDSGPARLPRVLHCRPGQHSSHSQLVNTTNNGLLSSQTSSETTRNSNKVTLGTLTPTLICFLYEIHSPRECYRRNDGGVNVLYRQNSQMRACSPTFTLCTSPMISCLMMCSAQWTNQNLYLEAQCSSKRVTPPSGRRDKHTHTVMIMRSGKERWRYVSLPASASKKWGGGGGVEAVLVEMQGEHKVGITTLAIH